MYQKRGRQPGHELDDWLEAERLVDREGGTKTVETKTVTASTPTPTPTPTPTKSQPQRSIPTPIRNTSKVGYKRVNG